MDEVDSGMHWPLENKTDQAWMSKFNSTHIDSVSSRPSHMIQSTFPSHQSRISEISFSPIFMSNHISMTSSSNKASCTKWNDVDLAAETSPDVLTTCDSNCQVFIASNHCTEPDLKSRCSNNVVHKTGNTQETNNPMWEKTQHEFLMEDTKFCKIQVKTQAHKTSSGTTQDDVDNPKIVVIKAAELHFLLRAGVEKYLLIDCRSFLEYNTCHVQQAINVCCSKIVKRRLQQDKVHIRDLLMQTRDIDVDEYVDVIVYDQCTENPDRLTEDNFLTILLKKLLSIFQTVALVKGGFLAFQAMYPSLCESKTNSYRCAALTSLSQPCLPVTNVGPTRILPFLYLGSQQDALSPDIIQVNEITYVLNVSTSCMKHPYISDGHFLCIPINDNYSAKLTPYFEQAFQFLDKVRESNGCCLVHCLAGISRSPTLAIAYIMKTLNMSSDDAYRYVKDKRPTISPNFNFLGQLLEYEKQLKFPNSNKNHNNSSNSRIDSLEVKLSETNGNQVTNKLSAQDLELAPSCSSYKHIGGLLACGDWTQKSQGSLQTCAINTDTFVKSRNLVEDKCFSDTGMKVNVKHHKSLKCTSRDTDLDSQSSPFPVLKSNSRLQPSALNLRLEPEATRRVPASLNVIRNIGMVLSKSLTDIKEASETLSPMMTTMHECTVSTSYSSYQSQNTDTLLSPFPCGESTIINHISQNKGSSSIELTTAQSQNNALHSNFMVVTNSSKSTNETSSPVESKSFTNSVTSDTNDNFSGHLLKSGEMRQLRSSLSLSLSPVLPSAQCSILEASPSNSDALSTSAMICARSAGKIDQKLSGQHPNLDKTALNIPTFFPLHSATSISSTSSLTTSHVVKLKSFNLVSSLPFNLSAQSPTSGLARLNFGSPDNNDNVETISMDIGEFNPHSPVNSNFRPSDKPVNKSLEKLNSFPSTSLDKLNFTPCFSSSIENVHSLTISLRTSGVKRPLYNEIVQIKQSDVTPPTDSSSNNIVISPTNGTEQKQMVHKREGRAKRTLVRPNSIAFSKYPTFDLGSDCQESPPSSTSSSASQDDSSEVYAHNGKKKKPLEYVSDVKFRLGHYSEREVYRQITAAMEAAMMKSQAFEASRKSRSLDNILSSEDDSSTPNCESSHFDRVLRNFAMNRDKFSSPPLLLEKHACGKNVVDHYNSNSSLSSTSSHTSVHGSMELIQVS